MKVSDIFEGVPMGSADINSATKFQYSMGFEIELLVNTEFIYNNGIERSDRYTFIKQDFSKTINVYDVVDDTSLSPERKTYGAEIISAPYNSVDEGLFALKNALAKIDGVNYKTNESCGLHVTLGKFSKKDINKIDLLKFSLLINGDMILRDYAREDNEYCDLEYIGDVLLGLRDEHNVEYIKLYNASIPKINEYFKSKSLEAKYSFINIVKLFETGLIEIRAFGNTGYEKRFSSIEKHVKYIVRALDIARDPNAYRNEYLKKIYKFINRDSSDRSENLQIKYKTLKTIQDLFDLSFEDIHGTELFFTAISKNLQNSKSKQLVKINKKLSADIVRALKKNFINTSDEVKQLTKSNFEKFLSTNTEYPKINSMIKYILA